MELITEVGVGKGVIEQELGTVRPAVEVLATMSDPRDSRGRRYSLVSILCLIVAGLLCKKTSLRAIARWGRNQPETVMQALGFSGNTPCCATLHRVLSRLDGEELDNRICEWLRTNTELCIGEGISVDGKSVRGVPGGLHLLSAYAHQAQVVLAQEAVSTKENEIAAAPRVLSALDLQDKVISGDAMLAQRSLSEMVCESGGDYLWVVKDNQPTLKADIELFFDEVPFGETLEFAQQHSRHGGRDELRELWASSALNSYLDWPNLGRVCKLRREVTCKGKTAAEVAYAITSLSPEKADAVRLLGIWRGHWGIENGLHWVRDVVYGEDKCRITAGQAPRVCAILRNLALGLLRRAGVVAITEALERYQSRPLQALALLGIT